MQYHPVSEIIVNLLKTNSVWFETFEHEPVRTSEEAAKIRHGYSIEQGAKALIIKVYPNSESSLPRAEHFAMIVVPGNLKFDEKKVNVLLGVHKLRFASEDEVLKITGGVQPGGVPPFGNLFNLETYVEEKLFENERIVFNAGDKRFSVAMNSNDYRTLLNPRVVSIT